MKLIKKSDYSFTIFEQFKNYMLTKRFIENEINKSNNSNNSNTSLKVMMSKNNNDNTKLCHITKKESQQMVSIPKTIKQETIKQDNVYKDRFYFPYVNDSLFWCFYIMKNGIQNYEMLDSINIVVEKNIKIKYIETIRKNKQLIKSYKLSSLTNIENSLLNEEKIDIPTFISLCILEKLNFLYIYKNIYYELNLDDDNSDKFYSGIIFKSNNTYNYGIDISPDNSYIQNCKQNFHKIENISKPMKSLSSYTVDTLTTMCNTFNLKTIDDLTKKKKLKKDLYEMLIQYFS